MPNAAESVKEMAEGDDDSGGATVPADDHPAKFRKGDMVKWKANCHAPGMKAGYGMVKSIHTKGVVPGVDNDAEASEDEPHARVHLHAKNDDGEYAPMGDHHMAHPVKCLKAMTGAKVVGRKPESGADKSFGIISIKGQYLGDTDETMACAALERLHSILGWYLFSCIRSDRDVTQTVQMAGGAIDEYKETALAMLTGILEEDDDDGPVIIDNPPEMYYPMGGYSRMSYDRLITKYLANLATYDTSRDGSVTVLSLEARSRSVVSALGEIRDLGRKFAETRLKEGRILSSSTRSRIQAALDALSPLVGDLTALLDESTPKPKREADGESGVTLESSSVPNKAAPVSGPLKPDPDAVRAALADFAHFDFLQNSGTSL